MAFGNKHKRLQSNNFYSKKKARDENEPQEKEDKENVLPAHSTMDAHLQPVASCSMVITSSNTVPEHSKILVEWEFASHFFIDCEVQPETSKDSDVNMNGMDTDTTLQDLEDSLEIEGHSLEPGTPETVLEEDHQAEDEDNDDSGNSDKEGEGSEVQCTVSN
ncbi:hypothetical protein BDQ17DRAFT_1426323 [Cyathus striatus]|nr:hypothetical protein BDQ17DRAFT_1426323 [Cyathus striatus]